MIGSRGVQFRDGLKENLDTSVEVEDTTGSNCREFNIMTDDMEKDLDEYPVGLDWRKKATRCGKCKRLKLGHPQPFGAEKCGLNIIEDEKELEEDDNKMLKKKEEMLKMNQRLTEEKYIKLIAEKDKELANERDKTRKFEDEERKRCDETKKKDKKLINERDKT